jgi:fatty-acyl-CoA synthase
MLAAWVPLSHDMGLLALLLMLRVGGIYNLSSPKQFMRSPLSWLRDIEQTGASLTTAPTSALKIVSKLKRRATEYKLQSLRFAWIGAEPVWPSTIREFTHLLAPCGWQPKVVRPTYGMAETVVGVSFPAPGTDLSATVIADESGATLLSNGPPLDGIDVEIWSDLNAVLDEGSVGRIMVRGDSVAPNYFGLPSDLIRGWRDTGDLGFLKDGQVYVVGRAKDVIIRGGVNHSAEHIEETIRTALGNDLTRVAAFSVIDHDAGREWFHVAIEARQPRAELREVVSAGLVQTHGLAPDFVHLLERGAIPMTSSGKIRRQLLREAYAKNRMVS